MSRPPVVGGWRKGGRLRFRLVLGAETHLGYAPGAKLYRSAVVAVEVTMEPLSSTILGLQFRGRLPFWLARHAVEFNQRRVRIGWRAAAWTNVVNARLRVAARARRAAAAIDPGPRDW